MEGGIWDFEPFSKKWRQFHLFYETYFRISIPQPIPILQALKVGSRKFILKQGAKKAVGKKNFNNYHHYLVFLCWFFTRSSL
jgi:hypothetical protein